MDTATLKMVLQLGSVLGRSRLVKALIAGLLALCVCLVGAAITGPVLALSSAASLQRSQAQLGANPEVDSGQAYRSAGAFSRFSAEQMVNAATIASAGAGMGRRAQVVGLITAIVESGLRNLDYGDRDSVGLFQQRAPWGPISDRTNPWASATMFFRGGRGGQPGLDDINGWRTMPPGQAAQAVQVSAFPDRYAVHVDEAQTILGALIAAPAQTADGGQGGGPVPATFNRQGNPRTVEQAIAWMRRSTPSGAPGEPVLNRCERYMNLAYGLGGGYATAIGHWNARGPRHVGADETPPRGALVFWRTANPAGHVGLSLGDGIVASTDYDPVTHSYRAGVLGIGPIADIDAWGPRLGWRAPNFQPGSGR